MAEAILVDALQLVARLAVAAEVSQGAEDRILVGTHSVHRHVQACGDAQEVGKIGLSLDPSTAVPLLNDMCQLMPDQAVAALAPGPIRSFGKGDIVALGKGCSAEVSGPGLSSTVTMNAYA